MLPVPPPLTTAEPEAGPSTPQLKKNLHPRPTQVKAKGKKRAVTEPVSNGEEAKGQPSRWVVCIIWLGLVHRTVVYAFFAVYLLGTAYELPNILSAHCTSDFNWEMLLTDPHTVACYMLIMFASTSPLLRFPLYVRQYPYQADRVPFEFECLCYSWIHWSWYRIHSCLWNATLHWLAVSGKYGWPCFRSTPFSDFFPMTHGPYDMTKAHDPWVIQCRTTLWEAHDPWIVQHCTTHGSWRIYYPWVMDRTIL